VSLAVQLIGKGRTNSPGNGVPLAHKKWLARPVVLQKLPAGQAVQTDGKGEKENALFLMNHDTEQATLVTEIELNAHTHKI
jgi:hypothetical protein